MITKKAPDKLTKSSKPKSPPKKVDRRPTFENSKMPDLNTHKAFTTGLGRAYKPDIEELIAEGVEIQERRNKDDKRLSDIRGTLVEMAEELKLEGFKVPVGCFEDCGLQTRETLSKELLIENGVKPAIIAKSYKTSEPYRDLRIKAFRT